MTDRPRLSDLTREQLLERAAECWCMAETASPAETRDALRQLAVLLRRWRRRELRIAHVGLDWLLQGVGSGVQLGRKQAQPIPCFQIGNRAGMAPYPSSPIPQSCRSELSWFY